MSIPNTFTLTMRPQSASEEVEVCAANSAQAAQEVAGAAEAAEAANSAQAPAAQAGQAAHEAAPEASEDAQVDSSWTWFLCSFLGCEEELKGVCDGPDCAQFDWERPNRFYCEKHLVQYYRDYEGLKCWDCFHKWLLNQANDEDLSTADQYEACE